MSFRAAVSVSVVVILAAGCGRYGYGGHVPGLRDATVLDAGVDGRVPDTGTAPCDGVGCVRSCDELPGAVVFCDDFDQDTVDPGWVARNDSMGPAPTVERSIVVSGTGSLHFQSTSLAPNPMNYLARDIDEVQGSDIYVRAYVWFPSADHGSSFLRVVSPGDAGNYVDLSIVAKKDSTATFAMYEGATSTSYFAGSAAIARDAWSCVQFHIVRGAVGDGALSELAIDGISAGTFTEQDTNRAFTQLQIGPKTNSDCPEGGGDCATAPGIYIDQLAVGSEEFPCDQ